MATERRSISNLEVIDQISGWLVGGGILTVMLFPVSVPIIALTVAAVIPLAVVGLAVGLVAAVVAAPFLLVRRLVRARRRSGGRGAVMETDAETPLSARYVDLVRAEHPS